MRTYVFIPPAVVESSIKKVNEQIVVYLALTNSHISNLKAIRNSLFDRYYSGKISKNDFLNGIEYLLQTVKDILNDDVIKTYDSNPAYKGEISSYFLKASKRKDFSEFSMLYAASVPHLMLYPSSGIIEIDSITKITIGDPR